MWGSWEEGGKETDFRGAGAVEAVEVVEAVEDAEVDWGFMAGER